MRSGLTVVATALSALLLVRSVKRSRRPSVVRQMLDAARSVLQVAAVVAIVAITGVRAPVPALVAALLLGLASGAYVGNTLQLDLQGRRCVAQRSIVGAAVWAAGLVAAQLAGVADRAGVLRVGQAISWFGLGVAMGTFASRGQRIDRLRRQLAIGTLAGIAMMVALAAGAHPGDDGTADAAPTEGRWVLDQVVRGVMDGFTSMTHEEGYIGAEISFNSYTALFNATYNPPESELVPGETVTIEVSAAASITGAEQQFTTFDVIQFDAFGWTGASVTVSVFCDDPIGDAPLYCSGPDDNTGTFTWEVPQAVEGSQFVVGVGLLNCDCGIVWVYRPELGPVIGGGVEASLPNSADAPDIFDTAGGTDTTGFTPAGADESSGSDDETITDDEALGTSIAVVLIAVLIGLIDLAEVPAPLSPTDDASSQPLWPPPDPDRIEKMADQADEWAVDAIVGGIDFEGITDTIHEIRKRARAGQSQPGDEEMLRAIRDAMWAIGERWRAGEAASQENNAAILGAIETMLSVEAEFGKAAAGTFGPTSATLYAGFVETLANRDKGLAKALGHGVVGGASALVGSRAAPSLNTLREIVRAGARNAAENAAEDIGHQLVDSGGDVTKIDPTRTAGSATVGFVTGSGGAAVRGAMRGDLPPPAPRPGPALDTPRAPQTPTAPAAPASPPPPPRILPEETMKVPVLRDPSPADALNPMPPPRTVLNQPPGAPPVDLGPAPADLFPDAPELPTMPHWPRDSDGTFLALDGTPLFKMSPEGPRDLEGNLIARVITDRSNRPIGFERADGIQVISNAHYDPGAFDTLGGQAADPEALPPTGQQPRP